MSVGRVRFAKLAIGYVSLDFSKVLGQGKNELRLDRNLGVTRD